MADGGWRMADGGGLIGLSADSGFLMGGRGPMADSGFLIADKTK